MWAMGVLLYTMIYGQFPFYDSDPQELFKKIKTAKIHHPQVGVHTSYGLGGFLTKLLSKEKLLISDGMLQNELPYDVILVFLCTLTPKLYRIIIESLRVVTCTGKCITKYSGWKEARGYLGGHNI